MRYYLVGGAVRDGLLGLPIKDRDWVVVGGSPEIMVAKGFKPIAKDFPIFLHPKTREEYALARTEKKVARGYKGFVFNTDPTVSLEDDLSRRDLTINAIAQTETGELIDPFGGLSDLQSRRLRHVSSAFCEDPLRVLRVARFLARFAHLGFSIAPETRALMKKMAKKGELTALVPERVWQECEQALKEPNPELFFLTLKDIGASAEVFPGFKVLLTSDVSLANLERVAKFSAEPWIRFAVLTTSSASMEELEALLESLPLPKRFKQLARGVYRYKNFIYQIGKQKEGDILNFLEGSKAFHSEQVYFSDLLKACEVDYYSEHKNAIGQYLPTQTILSLVGHLKALPKENDFQQIRALRLASIREWLGAIFCDRGTT